MINQIITSYGTQGLDSAAYGNSLFSSLYDDNTVWDDAKIWIDEPRFAQVFSRRLI